MLGITVRSALISLLLIISGCSDKTELNYIPPEGVILAFGDSLTQGIGSTAGGDYPSQLQQLTGRIVINAGIAGEMSAAGLQRLPTLLQQHQPALLILLEGGNDILRNQDRHQLKQNLAQMITLAQQQQIDVVLLAVPEKKLFSNSAPLYQQLAEDYSLVWEPQIIAELLRTPAYKSDAVHFNNEGYQALSKRIASLLEEHNAL
ncbi:GDSL-type esterase/lipase family protein [Amphritea sp. 1_MG-2023]|uniref:GDSL-type esterase/lipase family protein n=1 Tax=Amphritea sp. 1_MG-2023 TaxID=3062670 RepID=UPI0026E35D89|nr:GDSL-type esterase/lipase family protein [Amphritea sp. 1_MG-2023]MDO6563744.1 GDSL-type esterase/lipase family protein [Amphritea sp. 1_MG-2023]